MLLRRLLLALAMLGSAHGAQAHGIAGNRFFPDTLTFDDPAVADEAIVPNFSSSKHPGEGGDVTDNRFDWAFFRLLTPDLGFTVDSAWVHRNWGIAQRSGFDVTSVGIKGLAYRNDLHETLVSAGLSWGIGHSGAQGIGANAPDLLRPGIFFGKGFGDLPDGLAHREELAGRFIYAGVYRGARHRMVQGDGTGDGELRSALRCASPHPTRGKRRPYARNCRRSPAARNPQPLEHFTVSLTSSVNGSPPTLVSEVPRPTHAWEDWFSSAIRG